MFVSCLFCVSGTELSSSVRAERDLSCMLNRELFLLEKNALVWTRCLMLFPQEILRLY